MSNSPLLTLAAGAGGSAGVTKRRESAPVVHTAYNIECSPGRGYKSNDIHLLTSSDRLKLYLWQLPRSPFPLPTCVPMLPDDSYDGELNYLRWLEVMELRREHLNYSKTLERAQSLCIYVFHTHGQANDTPMVGTPGAAGATPAAGSASSGDSSRVLKEVEYQGKVGELVSAVKTMCGHDKGRFTRWFLHNIYEEVTFFRFSDYGSVEHVMRLVCLVLEIVDILALLEVLVHFLRRSPCFLVKNVVLAMIERHELAFCATDQIPFLLQSFVDRFHRIPKNADDKAGNVAQFFCKMYYAHIKKKEIAKLDLPFALLKPIAETARKNQDAAAGGAVNGTGANANGTGANGNQKKELSLEATNPIRRASRDPPPNLPTQLLAMALVFQLFSEPPQNLLLDPQKLVMFDEPLMEDNFLLRKREERGLLASATLFNLTSDGIVRDTIFYDTKEAREKHILPVYHKKQWHTAVLLTHFFRPPSSPAEDANGQVQLLKVDQIIDQMNVWTLHRGGSIYLDLQMSRQQQKVKRSKRRSRQQTAQPQTGNKRKAPQGELSTRSSKRAAVESGDGVVAAAVNGFTDGKTSFADKEVSFGGSLLGSNFSDGEEDADDDDLELELGFDESSSATEILSSLIVLRTLKRSSRPPPGVGSTSSSSSSTSSVPVPQTTSATITTLSSSSPLATPKLYGTPHHVHGDGNDGKHRGSTPGPSDSLKKSALPMTVAAMQSSLTPCEARMLEAAREAQDSAVASLYAATVCSISRRAMGSVIAKILQILEDDVKHTQPDKFARQINTTSVVHLVGGIMATPPGNAFLPRYMMSLAAQLEWLYEGCTLYDTQPQSEPGLRNSLFLRRLRCKLAVRLQLVGVIGPSKHAVLTICYRDRIVKTLFALLGTSVVSIGPGLSLFSWILDLIPIVNASVLHDRQFELVEALQLPNELKRRVWSVLPRPMNMFGAANVFVGRTVTSIQSVGTTKKTRPEYAPVDPWALLEHVPQLPSDALAPALPNQIPKRPRRVFRCV
ncbi:Ubiquitin-conjugating enzyme E2 4 [Phytophthora nicotianae]|uniref:Ubiquitin-conjugating enzyme E2 4 n=1 Tax=Phytophthora nicotianae TaxID=4792 RepID=A0A0W8DG10_PHYNI|nr:Ubiquitin-conjugating enzyme E2 4 [Phytophthora nicotianae]